LASVVLAAERLKLKELILSPANHQSKEALISRVPRSVEILVEAKSVLTSEETSLLETLVAILSMASMLILT